MKSILWKQQCRREAAVLQGPSTTGSSSAAQPASPHVDILDLELDSLPDRFHTRDAGVGSAGQPAGQNSLVTGKNQWKVPLVLAVLNSKGEQGFHVIEEGLHVRCQEFELSELEYITPPHLTWVPTTKHFTYECVQKTPAEARLAQARALSNQAKAGLFFCLSREEQQLVEDYDTGRLDSSQEEWRTRRLEWLELVTQAEAT